MQRRSFVKATGAGIATGIAGCLGNGGGGGDQGTSTPAGDGDSDAGTDDGELTDISFAASEVGATAVLPKVIKGEGIDHANGINLDVNGVSPTQVAQLVINEGVEMGSVDSFGGASANHSGKDIRVFGPVLSSHISIIVGEDSPYESWEDLQGERVGMLAEPSGAYYHSTLRLAEIGLNMEEDFEIVTGSPPTLQTGFDKGDLEAYVSFPPTVITRLLDSEAGVRRLEALPDVFQEIYGTNLPFHNLAAYDSWIQEDPDRARAAQKTFIEGAKAFREDPIGMLKQHTDSFTTDEEYQMAEEEMPKIYNPNWDDLKPLITQQIKDAQELGAVNEEWPTEYFADL